MSLLQLQSRRILSVVGFQSVGWKPIVPRRLQALPRSLRDARTATLRRC